MPQDDTVAPASMPGWLQPLLDHLPDDVTVFPRAAGQPIHPLAIGTAKRLVEIGVPPDVVSGTIKGYTRHPAYLRALARPGAMRHALDGQPVELVSEEHRHVAVLTLEAIKRRRREETDRRVAAVREAVLAAKHTETEAAAAKIEAERAARGKPQLKLKAGIRLSRAELERRSMAVRDGIGGRRIGTSE